MRSLESATVPGKPEWVASTSATKIMIIRATVIMLGKLNGIVFFLLIDFINFSGIKKLFYNLAHISE